VERRTLTFSGFGAVTSDLDRLHQGGYQKAGQWDLAQICDHLSYFIQGSLDGHAFKVPWLIRVLFGRLVLRRILKNRQMKVGGFTPQNPLPQPGGDEQAAVARLKSLLDRLNTHEGDLHRSPFFGYLTPQQWRDLHLIHCAHHLSFLIPQDKRQA
jgi:hypothetical protein